MSDDQNDPADQPTPEAEEPTAGRPSRLRRWGAEARSRAGSLSGRITRGLAAALAAVLLVGLAGGYAVSAVVHDEDRDDRDDRGHRYDHPERRSQDGHGSDLGPGTGDPVPPAVPGDESPVGDDRGPVPGSTT